MRYSVILSSQRVPCDHGDPSFTNFDRHVKLAPALELHHPNNPRKTPVQDFDMAPEKKAVVVKAKAEPGPQPPDALEQLRKLVQAYGKSVVQYGFIPLIIVLGMTITEPRPTLAQLLAPV
eukprot:jgi/Botrbrau1/12177/Bobra.0186s0085.1